MYTKRLSQGCFREVLRNDDGSVCRLQWDDFYMLVRGITPVKVTVENHFEIAVNSIYIIRNQTINPFKKSCIYQSFFVTLKHKKDELIELLQHQMDFLQGKLEEALTSVRSLTSANDRQPP